MRRCLPLFGSFLVDDAKMVSMWMLRRVLKEPEPFRRASASHSRGIVVDDDGFPLAVDIERLGARLAEAVTRVLHAAERHVRAGAVRRAVDRHESGTVPRDELLDAVAVERVNRARQAEGRRVRESNGTIEIGGAVETRHRTEQLLLRDLVV